MLCCQDHFSASGHSLTDDQIDILLNDALQSEQSADEEEAAAGEEEAKPVLESEVPELAGTIFTENPEPETQEEEEVLVASQADHFKVQSPYPSQIMPDAMHVGGCHLAARLESAQKCCSF